MLSRATEEHLHSRGGVICHARPRLNHRIRREPIADWHPMLEASVHVACQEPVELENVTYQVSSLGACHDVVNPPVTIMALRDGSQAMLAWASLGTGSLSTVDAMVGARRHLDIETGEIGPIGNVDRGHQLL